MMHPLKNFPGEADLTEDFDAGLGVLMPLSARECGRPGLRGPDKGRRQSHVRRENHFWSLTTL